MTPSVNISFFHDGRFGLRVKLFLFPVKPNLMSFYILICSEALFAGVCSKASHVILDTRVEDATCYFLDLEQGCRIVVFHHTPQSLYAYSRLFLGYAFHQCAFSNCRLHFTQ